MPVPTIVRLIRLFAKGVAFLIAAWVIGLALWARLAPVPVLGIVGDGLTPCPESPNCVATRQAAQTLPTWPMLGNTTATLDRIAALVAAQPRAQVVARTDRYVRAEFRSRLFRYVDDVEFLIVEPGEVHFRSASRIGRSDMGVNRARMEALRAIYMQPLD